MVKKTSLSDFESNNKKTGLSDFEPNIPDLDDYIVYPLVPNGLTGFIGKSSAGKSWFMVQLAVDISLGKKYLNEYKTRKMSVIYIDEDSPTKIYNTRLDR